MQKRVKRWSKDDLDRLHYIKTYIEENLADTLTLRTLSRKAAMNEKKLKEGFFLLHGERLKEFILKKRMENAHAWLAETDLPVTEIARRSGYPDVSSFYRVFRNRYGYTPVSLRLL